MGRGRELARLRNVVMRVDSARHVYVRGPAGVGKTALMRELARDLRAAGKQVRWVDGASSPRIDDATLACWLGRGGACSGESRPVLIVDGWEHLTHHRRAFQAALARPGRRKPALILASRAAAPASWRQGELEQHVACMELSALHPHEVISLLARCGVEPVEAVAMASRTYGDPLALSLISDVARLTGSVVMPEVSGRARLLDALVAQLIVACEAAGDLRALTVAAWNPLVDGQTMKHALGSRHAGSAFAFLATLAVVEVSERWLRLHPLIAGRIRCADGGDSDAPSVGRPADAEGWGRSLLL